MTKTQADAMITNIDDPRRHNSYAEFRILGPLEVRVDDREIQLGGGRRRALLAMLLLEANRVVPADRLIDAIWGQALPATQQRSCRHRSLDCAGCCQTVALATI